MKIAFSVILLFISSNSFAQYLNTLSVSPVSDTTVNVHTMVTTETVGTYISGDYTIDNQLITLSLCYYRSGSLAITEFEHDFIIELANNGAYTLQVNIYRSFNPDLTVCDFSQITDTAQLDFSMPLTGTIVLGQDSFAQGQSLIIYPNPIVSEFRIEMSTNLNLVSIQLYNSLGKKVRTLNPKSEVHSLENIKQGLYIIEIETDSGKFRKKVLVN